MDGTMIAQQLERVDQRCKSNTHRLDEMKNGRTILTSLLHSLKFWLPSSRQGDTDGRCRIVAILTEVYKYR